MRCPACGYLSFDRLSVCVNCGASTGPPPLPGVLPAAPAAQQQIRPARKRGARKRPGAAQLPLPMPGTAAPLASADQTLVVSEADLDLQEAAFVPGPAPPFALDAAVVEFPADAPPVIDRVEEIPERYWATQGARFPRRAVALLADLVLLATLLGLFLSGACLALLREGVEASTLLSRSGLEAALVPLALLAALLSLAYFVCFHAVAGRTPGKLLAGLEVRSPEGSAPTWGAAALRWLGAAIGLVCGGVGVAWGLFEPRRRSWADLLSQTVIAEHAPEDPGRARAPRARAARR